MVKQILFSLLFFVFTVLCYSQQEQCDSPKEQLIEDLSNITKCAIEKWEDSSSKGKKATRQLAIRLTTRRRVVRRPVVRKIVKRKESSSLASIKTNDIEGSGNNESITSEIVNLETEIDDSVVLPYLMVHQKPNFSNCESDNTKKCFDVEMAKHIKKYFSYPKEAYRKGIEGKVLVRFKINKYGEVIEVNATTSYEKEPLKLEAERIISELPKFSPAKHTGKFVNVSYGVPIVFKLKGVDNKMADEKQIKNALSFDEVEEVPVFNSCDNSDKEDMAKCFNIEMVRHIQNNFSYPKLAAEKNITGKVWVNFIVDTKGVVRNIKLRGKSYILKTEARRIVSLLPKLKPGKNNGKKVNTQYVLPINFTLSDN